MDTLTKRTLEIIRNEGYGSVPKAQFDEFAQQHIDLLKEQGLIYEMGMWYYYDADKPFDELEL